VASKEEVEEEAWAIFKTLLKIEKPGTLPGFFVLYIMILFVVN